MGASVQAGGGSRRSRRGGRRSRFQPMSEINVTPLVDVMLVLLIVFMVAAPLLTVGVPVKLPETAAQPLPNDDQEPLTVTVDTEGRIYIQKSEVSVTDLIPRLRAISAERADDRLYLRADKAVGYGQVMVVMGRLNAAGFTKIGLVTDPLQ